MLHTCTVSKTQVLKIPSGVEGRTAQHEISCSCAEVMPLFSLMYQEWDLSSDCVWDTMSTTASAGDSEVAHSAPVSENPDSWTCRARDQEGKNWRTGIRPLSPKEGFHFQCSFRFFGFAFNYLFACSLFSDDRLHADASYLKLFPFIGPADAVQYWACWRGHQAPCKFELWVMKSCFCSLVLYVVRESALLCVWVFCSPFSWPCCWNWRINSTGT